MSNPHWQTLYFAFRTGWVWHSILWARAIGLNGAEVKWNGGQVEITHGLTALHVKLVRSCLLASGTRCISFVTSWLKKMVSGMLWILECGWVEGTACTASEEKLEPFSAVTFSRGKELLLQSGFIWFIRHYRC
jgi:hypothetical protein